MFTCGKDGKARLTAGPKPDGSGAGNTATKLRDYIGHGGSVTCPSSLSTVQTTVFCDKAASCGTGTINFGSSPLGVGFYTIVTFTNLETLAIPITFASWWVAYRSDWF